MSIMTTHTRVRRTPWGDARFYIGVALVVLSPFLKKLAHGASDTGPVEPPAEGAKQEA